MGSLTLKGVDYTALVSPIENEDGEALLSVSVWENGWLGEEPGGYSHHVVDADRLVLLLRAADGDQSWEKVQTLLALRRLRQRMEREMGENGQRAQLPGEQAAMLFDVCRALGCNEGEMYYVLGEAIHALTTPIGAVITAAGRRVLEKMGGNHGGLPVHSKAGEAGG